jgi:hypothetical protein
MNSNEIQTEDDFDPMAESSFTPELVSFEKYNQIKVNGENVKAFYEKFGKIRAKYEATFVDCILPENDWTVEDANLYEEYKDGVKGLPSEWNINRYAIK